MKIAVLSDTRRPTQPDGHHGLGTTVHDIASGLLDDGHDVSLFAGPGSGFRGRLMTHSSEQERIAAFVSGQFPDYEVILDSGHDHHLSMAYRDTPVVNRIGDTECQYHPINAVVESRFMQAKFARAKYIRKGVRVGHNGLHCEPGNYLLYMSQLIGWKGLDDALEIARRSPIPLHFAGYNTYNIQDIPDYHGVVTGHDKWQLLGNALALIHPSRGDASPRLPLEAAAQGTPTICYNDGGTPEHVEHGVTGFICETLDDMLEAVGQVNSLDREAIQEWWFTCWDWNDMVDAYEQLLQSAANGEVW